jgi:kynureninase
MTDELLKWRDEFPILKKSTYLVSHSLGAMPQGVYDAMNDYADIWAARGVQSWTDKWWELNGVIGNKVGGIINAPENTVSIHQNVSLAFSILFSGMDFSDTKRNKIVITDMIFPSVYYVLKQMLPPHIELCMVKSEDGITIPTEKLLDAIDERTCLVPISHVLFRTCYIMPVEQIIEKAHSVGAKVLLDAYHAVGIVPTDVTALNVDFLIGGVLKWMCGGPGGVFLYVRPDLIKTIEPKITGWFAHQNSFGFEVGDIAFRDDAYRFLNGTFGVPSLYAIQPGIDIIAQVGVDNIRAKNRRQTALLFELAEKAGLTMKSPYNPDERGGMVVVEVPHAYEVSRELIARDIIIDFRPDSSIRIAPHFYNTDDEMRLAVETITDILESGDWQKHITDNRTIT